MRVVERYFGRDCLPSMMFCWQRKYLGWMSHDLGGDLVCRRRKSIEQDDCLDGFGHCRTCSGWGNPWISDVSSDGCIESCVAFHPAPYRERLTRDVDQVHLQR